METKYENVLYVKRLKQNVPSLSQLCDQGHTLIFHPKGCEINKDRKLIVDAYKTSNNLYILNDIKSQKYFVGKEDETSLWH